MTEERPARRPAGADRSKTTPLPADLPSFRGRLVARDPIRVRALRTVVRELLSDAASAQAGAEPAALGGKETALACASCGGHCCRNGDNSAYLAAADLVRIRRSTPRSDQEFETAYVDAVPARSYQGSCIFHAARGCNLPRELRSYVCLAYYCRPVTAMLAAMADQTPTNHASVRPARSRPRR